MIDMNLQRFATTDPIPTNTPIIPNGLPDKPGPKIVSTKGNVERLVVVLDVNDSLKYATKRVLEDGNVPAVVVQDILMTWNIDCYIGFGFASSNTKLGVVVGTFDAQGVLKITKYTATITAVSN